MKYQLTVTGEHLPAFTGPYEEDFMNAYQGLVRMADEIVKTIPGSTIEPVGELDMDAPSVTLEARTKDKVLLGNITITKIEAKAATEEDRDALRKCMNGLQTDHSIVINGVLGVYEDIWKKKYPLDTRMGANYTLGDLRSIKGWWQLKWYAVEAVSVFMARTVRMYAVSILGWDQETFMEEAELIAELLHADTVDKLIAAEVLKQACAKYGTSIAPDLDKSKALKVKIIAEMNKMFGAPADDPYVVDDQKYD